MTLAITAPARDSALPACLLERWIGRPAETWTADDLVSLAEERGLRLVSLLHVGSDGWLKTLDFVPRDRAHLRDILTGGERADGSSLFPGLGIRTMASDVVLRPRVSTAFVDPFSPLPTLAVMCGHAGRDGAALAQSPDSIVQAAHARLVRETGVELYAHGEVEYFLGRRSEEKDIYGASERGYHATSPFVFGEALRRRALALLAEIGVPVKYGHSEVGYVEAGEADGLIWEQHEIELALAPLPRAADGVVLAQWVLRNLAHRDGMRVSFDPILRPGHAGTGLHFHFSPVRAGEFVGVKRADGSLSEPAQWLIGGLVQLGGTLMAFGNRGGGSFVRLSQAKEAPNAIIWGDADRSALVRLPIVATTEDGRAVSPATIEFRLPDGSAHPHLLLAGVAQVMVQGRTTPDLEGLLARSAATAPGARSGAVARVPSSFPEVGATLARNREVFERGGVFPASLIDHLAAKLED
jgi:glutamine synthetase